MYMQHNLESYEDCTVMTLADSLTQITKMQWKFSRTHIIQLDCMNTSGALCYLNR